MNKRVFCTALLFLSFLITLCAVDKTQTHEPIIPSIPQEAESLSSLWNLYISSGEVSVLEQYTESFVEFLSLESYTYENQAYLVSEILFYTMFARHYCRNYSAPMDEAVTSFIGFIHQQDISPLSVRALVLFDFLAQKTNPYIQVNETQVFDFSENHTQDTVISSISKEYAELKLYESYSAVEGMYQRFENYRSKQQNQTPFKLSQDAFYRVLNNPSYLYLILFDERYVSLQDSFIRSCSSYLSLDERELRSMISASPDRGFTIFQKGFFTAVYRKVPDGQKTVYASLVYAASDLLYELERSTMVYGYPVDVVLSAGGFEMLLLIHENPFNVNCIEEAELRSLCESLVFGGALGLYIERVQKIVTVLSSKGGL